MMKKRLLIIAVTVLYMPFLSFIAWEESVQVAPPPTLQRAIIEAEEPEPEPEPEPETPEEWIRHLSEGTSVDADIAVAISRWETGHWKSDIFKDCNNFGGMWQNDGPMEFETVESGAEAFVDMLEKYYFSEGLDTVGKIENKYCPPSDGSWADGVNAMLKEYS